MSRVWICADLHLGHKNIHKYRGLDSSEEHDSLVLDNISQSVGKNDTLILVGDIAFTDEALEYVKSINVKNKILVAGNHCTERVHFSKFVGVYDHVHALWRKKGCWISHAPLHPDHLRGLYCVHGHIHDSIVIDPRYECVSLEHTYMAPVLFEDVVNRLINRNQEK